MKEDLGKEDEPKVKKIIGKLKKASDAHAGQAKDLQKAMTEDDMAKFHKMQKDGKSAEQIAKALDIDVKSTKKLMDSVMPDDKGEFINKQKHAAAKRGEKKPIDPEPKIGQIIKGEKETTRANGHMTKKKFSEMRMKLGQKGKTETGKEAPVIDTEPKAEKI
jgi:flagellum-specific peptidoglycan hydrolase FlgJ